MAASPVRGGITVSDPKGLIPSRPELHLSGPKLRAAYERLIAAAEPIGGVERFAEAVRLKSFVFQDRLGDGKAASLSRPSFEELVPLMATVRRRIGPLLEGLHWAVTREAIATLLDRAHDTTAVDARIASFEATLRSVFSSFPGEKGKSASTRFLRDLAAEALHNTFPEHYPLMQRWVWDVKANSGVVREIWHDRKGDTDEVDHVVIDVADGYETFLVLREELSQFLADNGVFRDMLWHVDLLCGQVYGDYINAQGGAWLKTDFGSDSDPLEHTRRILGLDRVGRSGGGPRAVDVEILRELGGAGSDPVSR